jgi:hypothetical protein
MMTGIMIYHIRSKYTAVGKCDPFTVNQGIVRCVDHCYFWFGLGRKEIVMFFYLYAIIELIAFFLDSNIIPTANSSYPVSAEMVRFRTAL